jgi:hypothetical protein
LYQPRMIDDDEWGAVGGLIIGMGNRSTRRKSVPVPLCPPQIPRDLTWARTRAVAVESRRPTAWAMARPRDYAVTFNPRSLFVLTFLIVFWVKFGEINPKAGQEGVSLLLHNCISKHTSLLNLFASRLCVVHIASFILEMPHSLLSSTSAQRLR